MHRQTAQRPPSWAPRSCTNAFYAPNAAMLLGGRSARSRCGRSSLSRALGSDGVVRPALLHNDLARLHQLGDAGGALGGVGLDVHAYHETALMKADADPVDSWLGPRRQQHGGDLLIVGLDLPPGPWGGPDRQPSWLGDPAAQHGPVPIDLGGEQRDDGDEWFVVPVAAAEVVCCLVPAVALHQL